MTKTDQPKQRELGRPRAGRLLICALFLIPVLIAYKTSLGQMPKGNIDSLYSKLTQEEVPDSLKVKFELQISMILLQRAKIDSAFQLAEQAYERSIALDYNVGATSAQMVMGHIHNLKGDQVAAIEMYSKEINRAKELGNDEMLRFLLLNRSSVYMNLEAFERAEIGLTEARELFETSTDSLSATDITGLATLLNNLGLTQHHQEKYDEALQTFLSCEEIVVQGLENTMGARFYTNTGNTAFELGNIEQSEQYYKRARELLHPSDDLSKAFLLTSMAQNAEHLGQLERAEALSDSVLVTDNISGIDDYRSTLYDIKYRLAKASGDSKNALKFHELFLTSRDSLNGLEKRLEFTRKEMFLEAEHQQKVTALEHEAELMIQEEQLQRNRIIMGGSLAGLLLIGFAGWSFYSNKRKLEVEKLAKNSIDNELKALRAQMNPHFNSNAMGIVIQKVRQEQPEEAIAYLSRFSRLMDGVLRNSELSANSLEDELTLLRDYIELQKERFSSNFKYDIHVDDSIEQDEVLIPSLIIQPYVENALEHGLSRAEDGELTINISESEKGLRILIKDDGIGHLNTEKKERTRARASMGTRITRERIELFNKVYKTNGGIKYQPTEVGTVVVIDLPLIYETS